MAGVGWIIMGIGFAIQVLVPVGIFGRPMGLIFGVPTQLAFVFGGTWILVIGLIIVYNTASGWPGAVTVAPPKARNQCSPGINNWKECRR